MANDNFLHFVTEDVLQRFGKSFVFFLFLFALLLLVVSLLKFEVLGDINELLALKFLKLSESVLIDGVNKEEDLEVLRH